MSAGEMPLTAALESRLRLSSLVRLSPRARLVLFVGALTLVKLLVAAWTPLASDEALYWRYSKHLAAGFIDHPFVNPSMIRLGTAVFGDTPLGVRVCAVLLSLPASWALGRAARLLLNNVALARTAVLYFNLTLVMSIGSLVATSDQAVVAATCFLLLFLAELQSSGRGAWWLAIGAALMLGSIAARRVVERIGTQTYELLIDLVLVVGAATTVVAMLH